MKYYIFLLFICVTAKSSRVPRLDGRIVGGFNVNIEEYPYQASVRLYDQHVCGGSILNDNTILTAAHCIHNRNALQFSVRVGSTQHKDGEHYYISKIIKHPDYNPSTFENDLAILKLVAFVNKGKSIKYIPLQPKNEEISSGTVAIVSGWGVTQEGGDDIQDSLKAVDLKIMGHRECAKKYGPGTIYPNMLCAQTLDHDSCQADSGGPLVANGRLVGVVSWGYGCARQEFPGIYVKVASFYDWIVSNM